MAHTEKILEWIRKYDIRSILDAPCGSGIVHEPFRQAGVTKYLGIDKNAPTAPHPDPALFLRADLVTWRPEGEWDAVYINCIFCTGCDSSAGSHDALARNYASWRVKYILLCDTRVYNWAPHFRETGWELLDQEPRTEAMGGTVNEIWGRVTQRLLHGDT